MKDREPLENPPLLDEKDMGIVLSRRELKTLIGVAIANMKTLNDNRKISDLQSFQTEFNLGQS